MEARRRPWSLGAYYLEIVSSMRDSWTLTMVVSVDVELVTALFRFLS